MDWKISDCKKNTEDTENQKRVHTTVISILRQRKKHKDDSRMEQKKGQKYVCQDHASKYVQRPGYSNDITRSYLPRNFWFNT